MDRKNKVFLLFILLLIIYKLTVFFVLSQKEGVPSESIDILETLSGETDSGFKRALEPINISFPDDMGPHPGFQTEWWYYTGNLADSDGRTFGYQLTFFRRALSPDPDKTESEWRTNQVYFAHFALSDIENKKFYSGERWSRDSLGLAGGESKPYSVWLEGWSVKEQDGNVYLKAGMDSVSIEFELEPDKPIALHGDKGLSQKGDGEGNASYYYSQTRLKTEGRATIEDENFEVSGLSWFDHEWSTSVLSPEQIGWDWFSIQLDDGRDVMIIQLRLKDGGIDIYSSGSLILPDGTVEPLGVDDFSIDVLDKWQSPETGVIYPSKWRVLIPSFELDLIVEPYMSAQEHTHSFSYWEGAVKVSGESVSGNGYVEMTGYNFK